MSKLNQHPSAVSRGLNGTSALAAGLFVIGGTATAVSSTVIVPFIIDGLFRALAAQTNTALVALLASDLPSSQAQWLQPSGLTGFYTQPAGTTVYYVLVATAAQTLRVVQGTYPNQPISPPGYSALGDGNVPDAPDGCAPVAIMKVISGGAIFVPGTTALTGIATFQNVAMLPVADRPF